MLWKVEFQNLFLFGRFIDCNVTKIKCLVFFTKKNVHGRSEALSAVSLAHVCDYSMFADFCSM